MMRHYCCLALLAAVLLAGVSGCSILSGFGPGEGTFARLAPLAEMPTPARLALNELTADGEIRALQQRRINGEVVYHIEAWVDGKDVTYDITSDGCYLSS